MQLCMENAQKIVVSPLNLICKVILHYNYLILVMDHQSETLSITHSTSTNGSISSHILAEKLMRFVMSDEPDSYGIQDALKQLKNKKNFNSKTFSKHIFNLLTKKQPNFEDSTKYLLRINQSGINTDFKKSQAVSILQGFCLFWDKHPFQNFSEGYLIASGQNLLRKFKKLSEKICGDLAKFLSNVFNSKKLGQEKYESFQEVVLETIEELEKEPPNMHCLYLIYYFNLYKKIDILSLLRMILPLKHHEVEFIFKDRDNELKLDLIDGYITKKLHHETDDLKKLIKNLKLDAFKYPNLIRVLNKNTLYYYKREQQFASVELKLINRPDLIKLLIQIEIDEGNYKNANHLINKYHVKEFYYLRQNTKFLKNKLQQYDKFRPTQIMNGENQQILTLKQLGIKEKHVHFIDLEIKGIQAVEQIEKAPRFGIDCEWIPSFNTFEVKKISIMQISLDKKAFIFDIIKLKQSVSFVNRFNKFIENYEGKIIGHTVMLDLKDGLKQLNLKQTQIKKQNIYDVAEIFKEKNPKQRKYSLKYITSELLGKQLSKYEQCSGWDSRPLRKGQLHYATLDAFVTLKLYDKLMEK